MYKGQKKRYVRIGKHGWSLGLLGFNGLQYFKTHDPSFLFYFSFSAFSVSISMGSWRRKCRMSGIT